MKTLKKLLAISTILLTIICCSKDDPNTPPSAPLIGIAIAGDTSAKITFVAPTDDGGSAITTYTVTSTPDNIVGVLKEIENDTIFVTGLTSGTEYTFTVTATNAIGTSVSSAASNTITPKSDPDWYYNCYPTYDSFSINFKKVAKS